ncbi:hypothetical protein CP98_03862 [Sphingobium yanoikuyae]|uniref:Uncharacterized protein n=1 Tax=Sphingobium yanoikuyae TaxID=13690 RepID=A0A084EFZ8_SPHYA|nr:DUF6118 family protein [Sphingobium yanoikuyae]KEZ16890.1 hypothetical protein CP98_03862 [Sphingobium yanoikuyae]
MDEKRWPNALPYEPPPMDPATRAFTELKGELALLRRAVEHVAAEKADIEIPDYSNTLAKLSKSVIAIERAPALQMTPEEFQSQIEAAAALARREDQAAITELKRELADTRRDLRATIGTAATIAQQERDRWRWAGGGFVAGCLAWAVLPGFVARIAPTDWHWPERLAARTVREPTLWQAGIRIMQADSPQAWQFIADAAELRRDNHEAIDACEQQAVKAKQPVRCTIRVRYRQH